jgi:hypothetical protein
VNVFDRTAALEADIEFTGDALLVGRAPEGGTVTVRYDVVKIVTICTSFPEELALTIAELPDTTALPDALDTKGVDGVGRTEPVEIGTVIVGKEADDNREVATNELLAESEAVAGSALAWDSTTSR